jgi:hypothetical protein
MRCFLIAFTVAGLSMVAVTANLWGQEQPPSPNALSVR